MISSMFFSSTGIIRIILNDSQGIFFCIPLVIILCIAVSLIVANMKNSHITERIPWFFYSTSTYLLGAASILYTVSLFLIEPSFGFASTITNIIIASAKILPVLVVAFVIIGIIAEITKPAWKGRLSLYWIPLGITVLFWVSTFLFNNDGLWYNDPKIMIYPTIALLLPSMLCSIVIQRAGKEKISLAYYFIGSGFFVMFLAVIIFLFTFSANRYDFTLITLGILAMLTLIIIGADIFLGLSKNNTTDFSMKTNQ